MIDMLRPDRITALREARGWTQGQLMLEVQRRLPAGEDFSRSTLTRLENGERNPRALNVAALAQALGVSSDYLLGLTDDPTPSSPPDPDAPAAELVPLVRRLNALPGETRGKLAAALVHLLDALTR